MNIEYLKLTNFRNYQNYELEFVNGLNIISGSNGVGKSNIIESLCILSNLKSYRNAKDIDMIKWGEEYYHCAAKIVNNNWTWFEIGCLIQNNKIKKKQKLIQ